MVIRKIISALVLVPLALIIIAFAVMNRQTVVLHFDPFNLAAPKYTLQVPLFVLVIVLVIAGVIIGGIAAWLRQSKWRRSARHYAAEARALQAELDRFRHQAGTLRSQPDYRARPQLTIPPPAA
jgi:uncharacterized integral membrane protein